MLKKIKEFLGLAYYTSEPDIFLASLEKKYPKLSSSQQAEITKYQRIFDLRDHADADTGQKQIFWDKF